MTDPRLARRRRQVREEASRARLARLVPALLVLAVLGAGLWLLQSPLLSVARIDAYGVRQADLASALQAAGVETGRPLASIRPSRLEELLENDPWVADASVDLVFPNRVVVEVAERRPVAWAPSGDGWVLLAGDGTVVARAAQATPGSPQVQIEVDGRLRPGHDVADADVRATVTFLATLPAELARNAVVIKEGEELVAAVAGHRIRLGAARAMAEKAVSLRTMLAETEIPDGWTIDLLAPGHPALVPPTTEAQPSS